MWSDLQEGLTDDDEGRDVEEGIRGQIMEIQLVVVHETSDEGMKGEPKSSKEVGDKTTLSPGSGVGMTCPGVESLCLISTVKYLASHRSWMLFSVAEEAFHLP